MSNPVLLIGEENAAKLLHSANLAVADQIHAAIRLLGDAMDIAERSGVPSGEDKVAAGEYELLVRVRQRGKAPPRERAATR